MRQNVRSALPAQGHSRRALISGLGLCLLAIAGLGGCAIDLPGSGEPPRIFTLTPKSTFDEGLPNVDWQLLVELPTAPAGINTARIAAQRTAIELDYFARASWTDAMPSMVQTLLIESFENSGKIVSVGRQVVGLRADYILKTDIREFQAEYQGIEGKDVISPDSVPNIRMRVNVKLVRMPDRRIIANQTFEYNLPAPGPGLTEIVMGFDEVLGKVLKRAVGWALTEGEANRLATPTAMR